MDKENLTFFRAKLNPDGKSWTAIITDDSDGEFPFVWTVGADGDVICSGRLDFTPTLMEADYASYMSPGN